MRAQRISNCTTTFQSEGPDGMLRKLPREAFELRGQPDSRPTMIRRGPSFFPNVARGRDMTRRCNTRAICSAFYHGIARARPTRPAFKAAPIR